MTRCGVSRERTPNTSSSSPRSRAARERRTACGLVIRVSSRSRRASIQRACSAWNAATRTRCSSLTGRNVPSGLSSSARKPPSASSASPAMSMPMSASRSWSARRAGPCFCIRSCAGRGTGCVGGASSEWTAGAMVMAGACVGWGREGSSERAWVGGGALRAQWGALFLLPVPHPFSVLADRALAPARWWTPACRTVWVCTRARAVCAVNARRDAPRS